MIPERLKSADTWIGALVTAAIAAAIFLFQAAGEEPPAELVDALEERISDGSGEPLEEVEELPATPSDELLPPAEAAPELGGVDGSGELSEDVEELPEGSGEGSGE